MARIRPLAHAPVVEAVVDLRVHAADGMTSERLDKALEGLNFGYHKKGPILRGSFGFTINPQETPAAQQTVETTIVGVRLHSTDEKYVAQFTTDGFSVSRLAPYESWDALLAEARRVWVVYQQCVAPLRIHRTATRFINDLRLPLKQGERFEKYLVGLPVMPPEYPQTVSSFLQRFVIYDEQCGATGILTQALEQFIADNPLPIILDIDVFKETKFTPDSQEVWNFLTELRGLKNRFFFGALTEEAVELYA